MNNDNYVHSMWMLGCDADGGVVLSRGIDKSLLKNF